jgi:hypothetical protein
MQLDGSSSSFHCGCKAINFRLNIDENACASSCRLQGFQEITGSDFFSVINNPFIRRLRGEIRVKGVLPFCGDCCNLSKDIVFDSCDESTMNEK